MVIKYLNSEDKTVEMHARNFKVNPDTREKCNTAESLEKNYFYSKTDKGNK